MVNPSGVQIPLLPFIMPRNEISKIDLLSRMYKIKTEIDKGLINQNWSDSQKSSATQVLYKVLDVIQEYRY